MYASNIYLMRDSTPAMASTPINNTYTVHTYTYIHQNPLNKVNIVK